MIEVSRRGLLTGFGAVLITAPAIVRAASLMAVKVMPSEEELREIPLFFRDGFIVRDDAHAQMIETIRRAFLPSMKHPLHDDLMRGLFEPQVESADLERLEILLRARA